MIIQGIEKNLDPDESMVLNNSIWTFGHVVKGLGPAKALSCFETLLYSNWVRIFSVIATALQSEGDSRQPDAVVQNIGITLGIIGSTIPQLLVPHANDIFCSWCKYVETNYLFWEPLHIAGKKYCILNNLNNALLLTYIN